jgi:hypothetical protein
MKREQIRVSFSDRTVGRQGYGAVQENEWKLPKMRMVHQRFRVSLAVNVSEMEREWGLLKDRLALPKGGRVAVGVGIHGGATAEGQKEVLRLRGIT